MNMMYNLLIVIGLGMVILLISSDSPALAQSNVSNQTLGQADSSDTVGQANLSTFSLDTLSNMSNITTPEGDVNTYR